MSDVGCRMSGCRMTRVLTRRAAAIGVCLLALVACFKADAHFAHGTADRRRLPGRLCCLCRFLVDCLANRAQHIFNRRIGGWLRFGHLLRLAVKRITQYEVLRRATLTPAQNSVNAFHAIINSPLQRDLLVVPPYSASLTLPNHLPSTSLAWLAGS